ncbi:MULTISPECIES: hypothetical protein [unclassified Pseudoclavibacter]|uniref:hypothetical protein n=1 Tax=unclassified Pseudoclavibacter TaxID=2615177 RepID=UPI001BA7FBEF|nr:hypothetical protein [Pseudoclavibacter sp. Marseille-Q4354]MBS3180022.1 hypothetical protein [Pseudoclavibacter sp. Marseille-Q4354]
MLGSFKRTTAMRDRWEEQRARQIVSEALGAPVRLHDDGTAHRMPDAMIELPGGDVPMEIVSDPGKDYQRLEKALRKHGDELTVPGLRWGWQITLEHAADVRALRRDLPEHLEALEAREESAADYISTPPELRAMGVQHTIPLPAQAEFVRLYPRGWVVDQARPETALNDFVESMLAENDDVPKKLSRIDAPERHAFLWVMPESGRAVVSLLGVGRDWPKQDGTGLSLPDGVSHVWVASTEGGSRVMHWKRGKWLRIERSPSLDVVP